MPHSWTIAQIPDLTGCRAMITGANSGIGYPTALELARHGAEVVVASRSADKGAAAVDRINEDTGSRRAEFSQLDLASLPSVHDFAARELARDAPLHLLINNAGVYEPPTRQETSDGFELQFGTNVLGHFALTGLLLPAIERSAIQAPPTNPPRIVTVASIAHRPGRLQFDDLQFQSNYSPRKTYAQSKLANLMLALELTRRLRAAGSPILSTAAHPGLANTNLFKPTTAGRYERRFRHLAGELIGTLFNNEVEGALPTLYAATAKEAVSGGYYGPQSLFETHGGDVGPAVIAPHARDVAAAQRLWSVAENLTGVHYLEAAPA